MCMSRASPTLIGQQAQHSLPLSHGLMRSPARQDIGRPVGVQVVGGAQQLRLEVVGSMQSCSTSDSSLVNKTTVVL
jgi:hypothetical protein